METVSGLLMLIAFLMIYLLPVGIAFQRRHRDRLAITAIDILLGFTVLGWIAALIWSLTGAVDAPCTHYQRIHRA